MALSSQHLSSLLAILQLVFISISLGVRVNCYSKAVGKKLIIAYDGCIDQLNVLWATHETATDHVYPVLNIINDFDDVCGAGSYCVKVTPVALDNSGTVNCRYCLRSFHLMCLGEGKNVSKNIESWLSHIACGFENVNISILRDFKFNLKS